MSWPQWNCFVNIFLYKSCVICINTTIIIGIHTWYIITIYSLRGHSHIVSTILYLLVDIYAYLQTYITRDCNWRKMFKCVCHFASCLSLVRQWIYFIYCLELYLYLPSIRILVEISYALAAELVALCVYN